MITSSQIYWLLMLDNLQFLMCGIGVLFVCLTIMSIVVRGAIIAYYSQENPWRDDGYRREWESNKRLLIKIDSKMFIIIPLTIIFITIASLIPNTKQMAIILVAPKVINNEQVQKLPNQVLELANEWLEELTPKKDEVK